MVQFHKAASYSHLCAPISSPSISLKKRYIFSVHKFITLRWKMPQLALFMEILLLLVMVQVDEIFCYNRIRLTCQDIVKIESYLSGKLSVCALHVNHLPRLNPCKLLRRNSQFLEDTNIYRAKSCPPKTSSHVFCLFLLNSLQQSRVMAVVICKGSKNDLVYLF